MAFDQFKTQVLLLHSEQSTLDALSVGFSDRFELHCATSGTEALNTLGSAPVDIIVSAQDLPGMSGLDALREAKKRSPKTLTILLAGAEGDDGLEALVGKKELFQVIRGPLTPEQLMEIVEEANQQVQLAALAVSANDKSADVDAFGDDLSTEHPAENIVMETGEHGALIISDGTGEVPALKLPKKSAAATSKPVDIVVLTRDEEFLKTIRESSKGTHKVHHASRPGEAEEMIRKQPIGVLVTDAALASENIEAITQRFRQQQPRLVAVVAGRRDDGETMMDLINRGTVYRFLLKPVSPGRARLAIEASAKHHLDAPDVAFKARPGAQAPLPKQAPKPQPKPKAEAAPQAPANKGPAKPAAAPKTEVKATPTQKPKPKPKPEPKPKAKKKAKPKAAPAPQPAAGGAPDLALESAMDGSRSFSETVTDLAATVARSLAKGAGSIMPGGKSKIVIPPEGSVPVREFPYDDSPDEIEPPNYTLYAGVAVALLAVIGGGAAFFLSQPDEEPVATTLPAEEPSEVVTERISGTESLLLLSEARTARTNGNLFSPAGRNAVEYYIQARDAAPDNEEIQAEFAEILDEVFASAESSLLNGRMIQASRALRVIELADPESTRLTFLTAQLRELELRTALDDVRAAINQARFEDAGRLLRSAEDYVDGNSPELEALSIELAAARSDQQLDEVLAMAAQRLASNQLVSPSSDNARYFYELALAVDPGSTEATQGLIAVASKLVLRARAALDDGELSAAEDAVRDAQVLNPESSELQAVIAAIAEARSASPGAAQPNPDAAPSSAPAATAAGLTTPAPTTPAETQSAAEAAPNAASSGETAEIPEAGDAETVSADAAEAAAGSAVAESAAGDAAESEVTPPRAEAQAAAPVEMVSIASLKRTKYVPPSYPRAAQRRNLSGYVDVVFTVDESGGVTDVEVREFEPSDVFNDSAIKAVSQWEFEPSMVDGIAVARRVAVRMSFNLQ